MKTPSKKTILIIAGALLLLFVLRTVKSRYENRDNKNDFVEGKTNEGSGSDNSNSYSTDCDKNTVLKKGQRSKCVFYAQKQFNRVNDKLGIRKLSTDGIFGDKTENAFQKLLNKKTGTYEEIVAEVNKIK